ncbi:MAG: hypothetical protein WCH34_15440 [Bacteroidota bacterium]
MNIVFFNKTGSKINKTNEEVCVYCNILISDVSIYFSLISQAIKRYRIIPSLKENEVIRYFFQMAKRKEDFTQTVKDIQRWQDIYKKALKVSHKGKNELFIINYFKSMVNDIRDVIESDAKILLEEHNLSELLTFVDDRILEISPLEFEQSEKQEDLYLGVIVKALVKRDYVFFLDPIVDELFSHHNIESKNIDDCDFIKLPLWDFPQFIDITYQQMKYTRDQLQDVLKPFKTDLKELLEKLLPFPFNQENLPEIKQLCLEQISKHINPIQNAMDESIYISKQKNKFANDYTLTYCLGISSAQMLIDFYEKAQIVLPYVASEIKQQVSRHLDLNTSFVFAYCVKKTVK